MAPNREYCPRCGQARTGNFQFCRNCGFDFATPGVASASDEPAPVPNPGMRPATAPLPATAKRRISPGRVILWIAIAALVVLLIDVLVSGLTVKGGAQALVDFIPVLSAWAFGAALVAALAVAWGRSGAGWFLLAIGVSPLIAFVALVFVGRQKT